MNKPDKGLRGGSCNVTSCQKPNAVYFNKSTKKYYCKDCADEINWPGGRLDAFKLYGRMLLCELDQPTDHKFEVREDGLANCLVCGGAEAALPTNCPGYRMSANQMDDVQYGKLDYIEFWVTSKRNTET